MRFLRTTSTKRLLAVIASALVAVILATTIALAATGATPPPKQLASAIHDAMTGTPPKSLSARVTFTNKLIGAGSLQGGSPLLNGASGRLWVSGDNVRLELQSQSGDAQIVSDGKQVWAYDASSNTVYKAQLPQHADAQKSARDANQPPTLAKIQDVLNQLEKQAGVSGAQPGNVAGQPAYTVTVTPKDKGGLVGAAELAWDAARGVPLRAAVYARGDSSPVLELKATDISYDSVPASAFDVSPPKDAKVVELSAPAGAGKAASAKDRAKPVTGVDAVAAALPFKLSAPDSLAGLQRSQARLLQMNDAKGAIVTYGKGLGTVAVIETPAKASNDAAQAPTAATGSDGGPGLSLPSVDVNGAKGQELETPLGTVVRFQRGGVDYTVIGSVKAATALAAAQGL